MSHGPSIYVWTINIKYLLKIKEEIVALMCEVDAATFEERKCVAEYIIDMLVKDQMGPNNFAFWNHREGQEVQDYREYDSFCVNSQQFILNIKKDSELTKYVDNLKLKEKIRKGNLAQKILDEQGNRSE